MPSYLGIDDDYFPAISKPSLQQYDNYQIYDLYCIDIITNVNALNGGDGTNPNVIPSVTNIVTPIEQTSFLAVQAYHVTPIPCDFNAIIQAYS